METNSKKILEAMPDFNDELDMLEEIKKLTVEKMQFEMEIKNKEADNFRTVMTDSEFFVGGKPVAVSYYENAFKFPGIKGNLLHYREHLITVSAKLDELKSRHDVYKQMQDLYKSMVFAERA